MPAELKGWVLLSKVCSCCVLAWRAVRDIVRTWIPEPSSPAKHFLQTPRPGLTYTFWRGHTQSPAVQLTDFYSFKIYFSLTSYTCVMFWDHGFPSYGWECCFLELAWLILVICAYLHKIHLWRRQTPRPADREVPQRRASAWGAIGSWQLLMEWESLSIILWPLVGAPRATGWPPMCMWEALVRLRELNINQSINKIWK